MMLLFFALFILFIRVIWKLFALFFRMALPFIFACMGVFFVIIILALL